MNAPNFATPDANGELSCDCLVIGSGAGGAFTACMLAEAGHDVLMLEEGPYLAAGTGSPRLTRIMPHMWREGGFIPIQSNVPFVFAEGRCVGGSTMVNAGLINTLPEPVHAEWESQYRVKGIEAETYRASERHIIKALQAAPLPDGEAGPLQERFRQGATARGYRMTEVPVALTRGEKGRWHKLNMQATYLSRAFAAGARLLADCHTERITFRGNRTTGARATWQGKRLNVTAHRTVTVCAGAIQTPLLLRRSGIRKNIGNSLRFHPTLRVLAQFPNAVHPYAHPLAGLQMKDLVPEISMGISLSSPPLLASGLTYHWRHSIGYRGNMENMGMYYVMTRSHNRGRVRNLPGTKSYLASYTLNDEDVRALSRGYTELCDLLLAAGATRLFPCITGTPALTSPADLTTWKEHGVPQSRMNAISIHAMGSCPMGEDDTRCAVDSTGRVCNTKNLFVHDASILPNAPGVNPQGPLMAVLYTQFTQRVAAGTLV